MNVLKTMDITIDDIQHECVVIRLKDYNDFMFANYAGFQKLHTKMVQFKKREEKQEDVESRRIEKIIKQEIKEQEREDKYKKSIELEIMQNKFNNEKLRREREEITDTYKELLETDPVAKVQNCRFCKKYRIFPLHFVNEDGKKYLKTYHKDKQLLKAVCCITCFNDVEIKKEERKKECSIYCNICQSSYIAYGDNAIVKHNTSIKHKKNKNINDFENRKTTLNFTLFPIKELQLICSKSVTSQGNYLIPNYTRYAKDELIIKMNEVYDKLVFDFIDTYLIC